MILKSFLFLVTVFFFQVAASGQNRRLKNLTKVESDSTKMPTALIDFDLTRSIEDNREFFLFTFMTKERPNNLHATYNLDSIQLFSNQNFITLKNVEKDTLCYDSSMTMFCRWKFTFPIDAKQREFLKLKDLDKLTFWDNYSICDKVYLAGSDKKLIQNKVRNILK